MLSVMIDDDLTLKKPSRLFLQVMLLGLMGFFAWFDGFATNKKVK